MKSLKTYLLASIAVAAAFSASAQAQSAIDGGKMPATKSEQATLATSDMTEGVVRKVDKDAGKLTIKHGDIKNLDMPGMTMVFQVKDPAMLDKVKAGDKIRFKAEKAGGAIVVTDIQAAR